MGDVADILGLGKQGPTTAAEEASRLLADKPKANKNVKKKPKGLSRELFSLMGVDGITPSVTTNKFSGMKTKRTTAVEGKWIWTLFKNSARSDNKKFYHWAKAETISLEYAYAKFNVKPDCVKFTDIEYDTFLSSPTWTRSETELLLHLCHKYDLRWPVIVDRYETLPSRTTEELQARYYGVVVKLREARSGISETALKNETHTIFDLEYERNRRAQQETIFHKTRDDELEENKLREELKQIDGQIKKIRKNAKLVNATDKAGSGANKAIGDIKSLSATGNIVSDQGGITLLPSPGIPCLQSTRLLCTENAVGLSRSLVRKMNIFLREVLNIPTDTLLPTRTVCDNYDKLRRDVITLLSLQTVLQKKEKELSQLRIQHKINTDDTSGTTSSAILVPHSMEVCPVAVAELLKSSTSSSTTTNANTTTPSTPLNVSLRTTTSNSIMPTGTTASTKNTKKIGGNKRKASSISSTGSSNNNNNTLPTVASTSSKDTVQGNALGTAAALAGNTATTTIVATHTTTTQKSTNKKSRK